ncbi:MAG: DUF4349 domain-containing protein [Anaerolineales bacterium]|nr:DUF4349 domain-containing protein [Anaerolineales bacterium]
MIKRIVFGISLITLLLAGCASARAPAGDIFEEVIVERESMDQSLGGAPMEAPAAEFAEGGNGYEAVNTSVTSSERIVLTNVNLGVIVADPAESMKAIGKMAEEMGGFIVSANLNQISLSSGEEVHQGTITVRVPSEQVDEAATFIEEQSDKPVEYKNIDSQDVTREYVNLQSRLRNLQAAEEQLIEIMNDAYATDDVLSVYNELVRVQEQIEVIQGQIKYFEEASSLSAISVELIPEASVDPLTVAGWQPMGIARDAVQALINTMQVLVKVLIWLVLFVLPVLLVIAIPILIIVYILLRWSKSRKQKREMKAAEADESKE